MTTTYVLGAGASCHAGYPLAVRMADGLTEFMRKSPRLPYSQVAKDLVEMFGEFHNIEDLITEIQLRAGELKDTSKCEYHWIGTRRGFLAQALVDWFREIRLKPAPAYAAFAETLVQPGDVIVTFNYDDSLERELRQRGKWDILRGYGFPLDAIESPSDVLILKLHGSVNWLASFLGGASGGTQVITRDTFTLGHQPVIHPDDLAYLGYSLGETWSSGAALPCLILPGRTKNFFYDTSSGQQFVRFWDLLWRKATEVLEGSDRIVICGYSLPSADERACSLLLGNRNRHVSITVVSGDRSEDIAERFRNAGFRTVGASDSAYFEEWVQSEVRRLTGMDRSR